MGSKFLKLAACFALAACASTAPGEDRAAMSAPAMGHADAKKPNILILMFDDLRFDTFSYRGGPVSTPHIDALAAESTRFDNAITTTGLCSPSRAAFFTGRWGHRTGLDDNISLWHSRLDGLDPATGDILADADEAGYTVGYVGKWHLGTNGPQLRGADYVGAWDEAKVFPRQYTPHKNLEIIQSYIAGERDENGEKGEYFQTLPGTFEESSIGRKVRAGQAFFQQVAKSDDPFFAVVSFHQPHPPYRVVEPYASMYDAATLELPSNHLAPRVNKPLNQEYPYWPWHDVSHMTDMDWRESRAHYYGAVAAIDRAVGELIASAKAEGIYDDLHIIFIGDQGSMIGEHGLYDKAAYSYDELMRIPLLMRVPGQAPRVVDHHVSLIDVPATMYEWMHDTPAKPLDGKSLNTFIKGQPDNRPDDAIYAFEWYNGAWFGIRAIRTAGWKYVFNPGDTRDELYDLNADPGEVTNLVDDPAHAGKLDDLRQRMLARLDATEDPAAGRLRNILARLKGADAADIKAVEGRRDH